LTRNPINGDTKESLVSKTRRKPTSAQSDQNSVDQKGVAVSANVSSGHLADGLTPSDGDTNAQRVVLIHQRSQQRRSVSVPDGIEPLEDSDNPLEELILLAESAGAQVVGHLVARSRRINSGIFFGKGTVASVKLMVEREDASLVVIDHAISPIQERNLERELACRVLDRTGLILDIFAQRASTAEGKLQVELAQLRYLSTRLVRGWTHLERQKGGIGLRGPGETQLETDRRLIDRRIRTLNERLAKTERQRALRRRARSRVPIPTVSLVGYTNAGKSSLFNRLTDAEVSVADQLFETLDPTMRRIEVEGFGACVLSDTVGFVRELPHSLVTAFHSTLEEVTQASLLLHVVDSSSRERDDLISHVKTVLTEIEADRVPSIIVMNKVDISAEPPRIVYADDGTASVVWLSAVSGSGCDLLAEAIASHLGRDHKTLRMCIPPDRGRLHASLHAHCEVLTETVSESGEWVMDLRVDVATLGWIEAQSDYEPEFTKKTLA